MDRRRLPRLSASPYRGWLFLPRQGAPDIDPYAKARMFHEGELPLAAGEGFALRTWLDAEGNTLSTRCDYRLSAPFPAARYWTVTLIDRQGRCCPTRRIGMG